MTQRRGPLTDVLVVERAGRLAVSASGHLLAALGARVVRVETADDAQRMAAATPAVLRLARGGKEIARRADVVRFGRSDHRRCRADNPTVFTTETT